MIFNIQKCSIHDGDGLRTLVFFKGCPLSCPWCANPESQAYYQEVTESPAKCIGCGLCVKACPHGAIREGFRMDRSLCPKGCTACADTCYACSKKVQGQEYSVEDLYKEIQKDKIFYDIKGGGVTFSGGEPLTFGRYLREIAEKCQRNGINTCIESCGYARFEEFEEALPFLDSIFMDVKIFDSGKHREVIGEGNELILDNIRRISRLGVPMTIRTPVVPGYTDSKENIRDIATFVSGLGSVRDYELLPYHELGVNKYTALGREYPLTGTPTPSDDEMRDLVRIGNEVLKPLGKECFWVKQNVREVIG